jgi:hypothetical protein
MLRLFALVFAWHLGRDWLVENTPNQGYDGEGQQVVACSRFALFTPVAYIYFL